MFEKEYVFFHMCRRESVTKCYIPALTLFLGMMYTSQLSDKNTVLKKFLFLFFLINISINNAHTNIRANTDSSHEVL